MFYDLSTALSILASSSANAWCSCQLLTSFYITKRYNVSDKYCFLFHLLPPKFEHLSENCIRTSKCLNNEPIFAIIAKRKTEGGGTWQFPCSKAMPFFRAAGQRFPPGLIRATRPCSVRSGRHYDIILLWIYTVGKILAIILVSSSIRPSLKSALRPPPSALAESANFRPFYVKRADFSPPPPATKKKRKLVKIRPRCLHLATKKRRKVVKIRPCGGWWVGGWIFELIMNLW